MLIKPKPLPDIIKPNLKILFIGYNPGIKSASAGHHYAGSSNRFWKLLFDSGLTGSIIKPENDRSILDYGYGSTNLADRTTRSAAELTAQEMKLGSQTLFKLLNEYTPKIVCYVGIGVYRAFKSNISGISPGKLSILPGLQETGSIDGILDFVCYNPSGLNTVPYARQLDFFKELKRLSDDIL